ncbi:MAG TPA: adenylate/guanylate cyclase domain-containing protein [Acidimicrobiales bacterium]|nr:adenylate/guanylate cyclase domain-containing protein [Acidimicrobiales bacterium]
MAQTKYARCDDLSLAYQVVGHGDIDLVMASSFVSHVELNATSPEIKAWYDRMGTYCRILVFDKAGVGLSDPVPKVCSIDDRAAEIEAVMDAAQFSTAVLMGISEGGPASILFAATRPDRVKALILTGTFARSPVDWDDLFRDPVEVSERLRATMGDSYAPSPEQVARFQPTGRAVQSNWGTGETLKVLLPSAPSLAQLGTAERMSASPGMARATLEAAFRIDVRSVLPTISVPTLVIHATDDPIPIQGARYLADHIPGARLIEIVGHDHAPWISDPDRISDAIEEFLTGTRGAPRQTQRALKTVLFTDMVESTARAAAMGDERWRVVLERFDQVTTSLAARFGGTIVKSTGDGHLATFEGPTHAIRCAEQLLKDAESLGVEIRAGIHTGECELMGDDLGGIAVHIAARIMSLAAPGEILVSSSLRDLVVGSGIGFDERGSHELKGVPGQWHLLAVDPKGAQPGTPEARLASLPTPSARSAMRRSDRAVASAARHAPWLLRGLGRVGSTGGGR